MVLDRNFLLALRAAHEAKCNIESRPAHLKETSDTFSVKPMTTCELHARFLAAEPFCIAYRA